MKPRWFFLAFVALLSFTNVVDARRPLRKVSLTSPSAPSGGNTGKKIVCYFTNWAQYRQGDGKFLPEDIDPTLCTHIIYAFGWMKKHKLSSFDAADDTKNGKKGLYERVIDLKKKNPSLKVLLAVGGWSFGTQRFKEMASNSYNRRLFIFSSAQLPAQAQVRRSRSRLGVPPRKRGQEELRRTSQGTSRGIRG